MTAPDCVCQKEMCRGRQTFVLVPRLAGNFGTEVAHDSTSGCLESPEASVAAHGFLLREGRC